ncbi:MAG: ribosomal protein S6 modification protein [Gammaproteobacteria bacterium RIFCSPHIGHO2_12_FULL_43_28]|nr:MAG: ribosomal protein S6 modification protein [Gammaproteobacteria bacterium RIFCSPHIGHO2_12_FULL_43_28]
MKIAIFSRKGSLYSSQRLVEAARARGHDADVIDTLRCYMNITTTTPTIHYKGKELDHYDAVIPRIGASITFYGAAVIRQLETMGVFCVNDSIAITRSRDKLRCLQMLSKKGIGLPITGFAHSVDEIQDLIRMVGGPPLIIKLLEGTQGIGVILVETSKAARSVLEAFLGLKVNIMVQEYIQETNGADIRCFVVGGKVVAAMKRQAKAPEEFRSNLHRGGTAEPIEITDEERKMAIQAARIIGLNIAGVDILRSDRGPLIMEVNSSPGLEGIEKTTGIDVAGAVIEYIEKSLSKKS